MNVVARKDSEMATSAPRASTGSWMVAVAAMACALALPAAAQAADPVISFTKPHLSVEEGEVATVLVQRSEPLDGQSTVDYGVRPGTPLIFAGDFMPADGILTLAPGVAAASFTVRTTEDGIVESDETVNLVLDNPIGAVLGDPYSAVLTIVDDDEPAPRCRIRVPRQRIDRSLTARLTCDRAARATLRLRLGKRTLAVAELRLRAAGTRKVAFRLSATETLTLQLRAAGPKRVTLNIAGSIAAGERKSTVACRFKLG